MKLRTLSDLLDAPQSLSSSSLQRVQVLVRVDFNVPTHQGEILDDSRLQATLPTLRALLQAGASLILLSHFGRPKGQVDPTLSLAFLVPTLSRLLQREVIFVKDAHALSTPSPPGPVILMENIRFHEGEEANDPAFAAALARLGDLYVNDAFSAAHRCHASVEALPRVLPSVAGLLFEKEFSLVQQALHHPAKPMMALVAGAKVSTKLHLLESLLERVDVLALGGGIANTFLAAAGFQMGQSLVEETMIAVAQRLIQQAPLKGCRLLLPTDIVDQSGAVWTLSQESPSLPPEAKALDLGPRTAANICQALGTVKTMVWNGPLGVFETPPFDQSTVTVAKEVARLTQAGQLISLAGGGETGAALQHAGVKDAFHGVSLSGGAFLEALEGKLLPGVKALWGDTDPVVTPVVKDAPQAR